MGRIAVLNRVYVVHLICVNLNSLLFVPCYKLITYLALAFLAY